MNRNPPWDARIAMAFCLATVASCFAMGYSVAGYLYNRLTRAS